jgi:hypothetical protein
MRFNMPRVETAPRMPVVMTRIAVSEGSLPTFTAIPIAIGVVTDLGATVASPSRKCTNCAPSKYTA